MCAIFFFGILSVRRAEKRRSSVVLCFFESLVALSRVCRVLFVGQIFYQLLYIDAREFARLSKQNKIDYATSAIFLVTEPFVFFSFLFFFIVIARVSLANLQRRVYSIRRKFFRSANSFEKEIDFTISI